MGMLNFLTGLILSLAVGGIAGVLLPYPYYLFVAAGAGFFFALKVQGVI